MDILLKVKGMATISDIAKICCCSTATVSKVLNNRGNISKAKRDEILLVAKQMKYVQNNSAKALASANKSSHLIGIILHISEDKSITHELFSTILNSFRKEIEKNGFDICFIRQIDEDSPYEYKDYIDSKGMDGVFVLSANVGLTKINNLIHSDVPCVGFDLPNAKYNVSSNNKEAVAKMVDYLASFGHKRIAYVFPKDVGVSLQRKDGFLLGLKRNNIPFDERMLINAPFFSHNSAKIATDKALSNGFNPTVIMYPDDYTAISAISYLRSLGMKVPSNISITGFDGVIISKLVRPSITTLCQDSQNIGLEAAKLLLRQINNEEIKNPHIVVKATLFEGSSVNRISEDQ